MNLVKIIIITCLTLVSSSTFAFVRVFCAPCAETSGINSQMSSSYMDSGVVDISQPTMKMAIDGSKCFVCVSVKKIEL